MRQKHQTRPIVAHRGYLKDKVKLDEVTPGLILPFFFKYSMIILYGKKEAERKKERKEKSVTVCPDFTLATTDS